MFRSARHAYENGARSTNSTRELEAQALLKAARLLEGCRADWERACADGRLRQALDYNQRLWTFFQSELSAKDHPMPVELRSKLLSLSMFVDQRTFDLRLQPDQDAVESLVRVNRDVAVGLSVKRPDSGPETPPQPGTTP